MTALPALLAAAAAAVAVGLPTPRRVLWQQPGQAGWRRRPPDAAVVAAAFLGMFLPLGPVGAVVVAVLVAAGLRAWDARQRSRARSEERDGASEALTVLASELRAGRSPSEALVAAAGVATGPTSEVLGRAAAASRLGGRSADALRDGAAATATPDLLTALGVCWQVCDGTGSSLAAAVDRLEEGLQAEREQRAAIEAELAGPRATALLMAGLPLVGLMLGAGLGAHPVHMLLHHVIGQGCLVAGVALDLLGVWWMGRIVKAAGGAP